MSASKYHLLNVAVKKHRFEGSSELHQIIRELAEESDVPKSKTGIIVCGLIDKIIDRTLTQGTVYLKEFGRFTYYERDFYTPITNQTEKTKSIKFTPSYRLKEYLNKEGD